MNLALSTIVFAGLLLCGCSAFKDPLRPIEGSDQLGKKWESASIKEHALTLTPLKIADDAPDTYRRLIETAKTTKDARGREILTVVGGQICPEHKFILDRAAGKIFVIVKFEGFESSPVTTAYLRQSDGWHYNQPPSMPLNNRACSSTFDRLIQFPNDRNAYPYEGCDHKGKVKCYTKRR